MRTKIYLHRSKESNWELGEKLGLKGEALNVFKFACYEVELEIEVDHLTGEVVMVKCDGMELREPPAEVTQGNYDDLNREKTRLADALVELDAQVDALVLQHDGVTFTHPDSDQFARASQKAKRIIKASVHQ